MRLSARHVEPNGVIYGGHCGAGSAAGQPRSVRGSCGQAETHAVPTSNHPRTPGCAGAGGKGHGGGNLLVSTGLSTAFRRKNPPGDSPQ